MFCLPYFHWIHALEGALRHPAHSSGGIHAAAGPIHQSHTQMKITRNALTFPRLCMGASTGTARPPCRLYPFSHQATPKHTIIVFHVVQALWKDQKGAHIGRGDDCQLCQGPFSLRPEDASFLGVVQGQAGSRALFHNTAANPSQYRRLGNEQSDPSPASLVRRKPSPAP